MVRQEQTIQAAVCLWMKPITLPMLSAPLFQPVTCALWSFSAGWSGLYRWWESGSTSTLTACFWEAFRLLEHTQEIPGWWHVEMGSGRTVIWEHRALSGSSMLPACLWRELQSKQEPWSRAMLHTKWSLESTRKPKSSNSYINNKN